jgi:serine/threonine protein kinase
MNNKMASQAGGGAMGGEDMKFIKQLGKGTFGEVNLYEKNGEEVVYKLMKLDEYGISPDALKEIGILAVLVDSPHILGLKEVVSEKGKIAVGLEYARGGDLRSKIPQIKEKFYRQMLFNLSLGVKDYLDKGIIHCDLKPENILLYSKEDCEVGKCSPVIADFGISEFGLCTINDNINPDAPDYKYTRWYRPPELLLGSKILSEKSDIWALGCTFIEIVTKTPFAAGMDEMHQLNVISHRLGYFTEDTWSGVTGLPRYKSYSFAVANKATKGDKERKEAIAAFYKSKTNKDIDTDLQDLLYNMLCPDPSRRYRIVDVLNHSYFNELRVEKYTVIPCLNSMKDNVVLWKSKGDQLLTLSKDRLHYIEQIKKLYDGFSDGVRTRYVLDAIHNTSKLIMEQNRPLESIYLYLFFLYIISFKIHEVDNNKVYDYIYLINKVKNDQEHYAKTEKIILEHLQYDIIVTTPYNFLKLYSKSYESNTNVIAHSLLVPVMISTPFEGRNYSEVTLTSILMATTITKDTFIHTDDIDTLTDLYNQTLDFFEVNPEHFRVLVGKKKWKKLFRNRIRD